MTVSGYEPGACNIGHDERRQRAAVSAAAFLAAGAYVVGYLLGAVPDPLLGGVFVPLAVGFEWGLQAHRAFCVFLALDGEYDVGGDVGRVESAGDRRQDRASAARLTAVGLALAGLTTMAVVFAL